MIVSLAYGKHVEMSVEQYLSMSENELLFLAAYGFSEEITDPFHGSALTGRHAAMEIEDIEEIDEELFEDLLSLSPSERLCNADFLDFEE